jgi:hypothetical protein
METEVRFYYSSDIKDNIIKYLDKFDKLKFEGRSYECTNQYNSIIDEIN